MAEAYEWFDRKRTMEILDESQIVPEQRTAKTDETPRDKGSSKPELRPGTQLWYDQLPKKVRPQVLRCQFPHIMDKLVEIWDSPRQLDKFFSELMVDGRGDRQGFPFSVIRELHCLRDFYFEVLNPEATSMIQPRGGIKSNL